MKRAVMSFLCATMLALANCKPKSPTDCLTREGLATGAQDGAPLSGLRTGTFSGQIVVPNRSNLATGFRLTGITCQTVIWRDTQGRVMAHPSYLDHPVRLTERLDGSDFYAGLVDDTTALIVQQYPGGVSATHTVFDANGVLVYGICGSGRSEFLRECLSEPE